MHNIHDTLDFVGYLMYTCLYRRFSMTKRKIAWFDLFLGSRRALMIALFLGVTIISIIDRFVPCDGNFLCK